MCLDVYVLSGVFVGHKTQELLFEDVIVTLLPYEMIISCKNNSVETGHETILTMFSRKMDV